MSGSLLVAGTSSDAGKSVLVAGLCRWLHRSGVRVAPFKAMNMSNNSVVAVDGGEIGRAQAAQAAACGLQPVTAMNPVLLKPGGERHSHVLVRGRELARIDAGGMVGLHERLMAEVLAAYDELAAAFDVVVCEGAGGAAEINLRDRDLANLGLARRRGLPVLVVGDVDRGGVFAGLFGTLALLSGADQDHVAGFVVNKFRGDAALLAPGLETLTELTGRPVFGVLPWLDGLALDVEDSLSRPTGEQAAGTTGAVLRVVVVPLPRTSNGTDLDALACEPGVSVRWSAALPEIAEADLVVLPGTRSTVADLGWLHRTGIAAALTERARRHRPVLGICGGYQMLAGDLHDDVESGAGEVPGLGLLPVSVHFAATKTVRRVTGWAYGHPVTTGYEIHHGKVSPADRAPGEPFLDGWRRDAVWGTTWHGAWESDDFRRAFLDEVAQSAGSGYVPSGTVSFAQVRQRRFDALADLVADHLDTAALHTLLRDGIPPGLPRLTPGSRR